MSDPFVPPEARGEPTPKRVLILEDGVYSRLGIREGSSTFPVPVFGSACVCCNAETTNLLAINPGFGSQQRADLVRVPACPDCRYHVRTHHLWLWLCALVGGLSIPVVLFGGINIVQEGSFGLSGVGLLGVGVAALLWGVEEAFYWPRGGHYRGFSLTVGRGTCAVHTRNGALADRLMQLNPAIREHGS